MARIPYVGVQSPFGNRGPDKPTPMNADTRGVTNGMEAATSAVMGLGGAAVNMLEQEQRREEALARAEAANYGLDDQIKLDAKTDEYHAKLRAGEIQWHEAEKLFSDEVDGRDGPKIQGLNEVDKINLEKMRQRNAFVSKNKFQAQVSAYKKDHGEAQIYGSRDKLLKFAESQNVNPDEIIKANEASKPLWDTLSGDQSKWEKDSKKFADDVYSANFAANFNTIQDSPEQLASMKADLGSEGYWGKRLGPEKAGTTIRQIDTRIKQLADHEDQQSRKDEKLTEAMVSEIEGQLEVGRSPGAENMQKAISMASKFPVLKYQLDQAIEVGAFVSDVLNKPTDQQEMILSGMRANLDKGAPQKDFDRYAKIEKTVRRRQQFRKENPIEEIERGGIQFPPIDFNDTAQAGTEIVSRMAGLDSAREKNPDLGKNLLKPHEEAQLIAQMGKMTAATMPAYIGKVYEGTGNDDAFSRIMDQVAGKEPLIAYAGRRYSIDAKAGRDPTVAVGVAKGYALLKSKDSGLVMPKDKEIGAAFAETFSTAYANRPKDMANDVQAVKAHYANVTAEKGDISGEFNPERWKASVDAVIGQPTNYEGAQVVRPLGMDEDVFTDKAELAISEMAKQYGLNTGWLAPDFALRNVPGKPGYYFLINEKGETVKQNDNSLAVNLND